MTEQSFDEILNELAESAEVYRGDFLHRSWVADAIADADVLIDTIDALREENTKLGGGGAGSRQRPEAAGGAGNGDGERLRRPGGLGSLGVTPGLSLAFPITDRPQGKPTGYGASCSASVREYTG